MKLTATEAQYIDRAVQFFTEQLNSGVEFPTAEHRTRSVFNLLPEAWDLVLEAYDKEAL